MAYIKKTTDPDGLAVYKVQVSAGRNRKTTKTWRPNPNWSARTTERELNKFVATLEKEFAAGLIPTQKEKRLQKQAADLESARLRTLQAYSENVFMPAKEVSISENTRSSYQQFLNLHILPVLGTFNMVDITTPMLSNLLLEFQKKGYAHSTVIKLYNILNGIFEMAFMDDTLAVNPMLKVQRPKPRKDELPLDSSEMAYTAQELQYILRCIKEEPLKWRTLIELLADTGMRKGEALALKWENVDFNTGLLDVKGNLQYTPSAGVYMTTPKNGKNRTVDIGPSVLSLLRELRVSQAETAISSYVFTQDGSYEPMHPDSPTGYFKKLEKRYGIKDFHPHKLRHTSASVAITHGADVTSVGERLGHSDASVTLRMYSHANEESIRRAGQTVRDALKAVSE